MPTRRAFISTTALALTAKAQTPAPVTFREFLAATPANRKRGVDQCLARIRSLEPSIQAWVQVSPEKPTGAGPLSGIPIGVKDIIETKGLLTEYGSAVYKGRIATIDAAIVRDLRHRGAIVLGKTQAAAFAWRTPPPTHNPHDLTHTPGGSSSGSAAAVAANMAPVTIGTQTAGSVLRPASYCGVAGFKGTHGLLSLEGVLPFSKSCDTLGFFTHTAADMLAFWGTIGQSTTAPDTLAYTALDPLPATVEPIMADAYRSAIERLRKAGLTVGKLQMPGFTDLNQHQRTIMFYEGARFHEERYKQYGDRLDAVADLVRDGLKITTGQYNDALEQIAKGRALIAATCRDTPIILSPSATGPAPLGLSDTGNAAMNGPWAAMGQPTISIPMPVGNALPLGLQIAGDLNQDARVLQAGVLLEKMLGSATL